MEALEKAAQFLKLQLEEAQLYLIHNFLLGLDSAQEAVELVLDHSSVLYGTCMGNANGHTNQNWTMLLAGRGFKHGLHLAFDKKDNTPIVNLYLSVLHRLGIQEEKFSSSTGTLTGLDMN